MHTTTDPQLIGLLIIAALALLIYFLHQSTDCEETKTIHGQKGKDAHKVILEHRESMERKLNSLMCN